MKTDPFRHHPELRDLIVPLEESFFKAFDPSQLDEKMAELGNPPDWRYTTEMREAMRRSEMAERMDQDLWVFAYGSLCWDPAIPFDEVRHARVSNHARRFILKDNKGARGTKDNPGLMAALADGPGCDGLAFHVPITELEEATRNLWARERLADAYNSAFLQARTAHGEIEVLAFVANPACPNIVSDLPRGEQATLLANGHGILGSSLEYIRKLQTGLAAIGIIDADLDSLLREAEALAQ